ncbi:1-aminocyclopropane-1-carboxylate deaminase/D-cysteine desulfhydrase [Streptomyces sp. NPDC056486]|uniref:1-aminocyclopropane-1-carboxylate deaminase/D-cysteine desulfhydrase n=1 Tax=Streptomyces sp. NPDC056486 TaxID=3345835 RepID=UPI003679513D
MSTTPPISPRPRLPSPLQELQDDRFTRHGVTLALKRDDLIHPDLPGNKYRKLFLNLDAAVTAGHEALLTFGGAYSNHLRATAAAGRLLGMDTIGMVRGDELSKRPLNPSLAQCAADGMRLHFIDRSTYRRKTDPEVLAALVHEAGARNPYVIPEGGSNSLAVQGCTALGEELRGHTDTAAVACGTGGTLAGMAGGLAPGQRALGIPVLKGGFLGREIQALQQQTFGAPTANWHLDERFHFGGYARTTPELTAFANDFEDRHGLSVERVYVAKLLYALTALSEEGTFAPGTKVTAVITATDPATPTAHSSQSSTSR